MTMRSPIVAMLWEHWRLTRTEAAWHLALSIAAGWAVLAVFASVTTNENTRDFGARIALVLVTLPHMVGWFSINKLNIARPGFPFFSFMPSRFGPQSPSASRCCTRRRQRRRCTS